jgi:hypothetical protein
MSYCRFAWGGSDVYVYDSVGGFLTCCGCKLLDGGFDVGYDGEEPDREALLAMVYHLRWHRANGHVVPLHAPAELSREANAWTVERAAWWLAVKWWAVVRRFVCRPFGHRPEDAIVCSPETERIIGPNRHKRCSRCREGMGFLQDDGTVRWFMEEARAKGEGRVS